LPRNRAPAPTLKITYWPVVEVLKQLDVLPPDESAATVIRSLLRETEQAASAQEIPWALRKTLEHAAAESPLVVVFDDIQWGEETFLELVEQVALLSSGAAMLVLCMARPELLERRPAWRVTRWHARFVLEARGIGPDEAALALAAVRGLTRVAWRVGRPNPAAARKHLRAQRRRDGSRAALREALGAAWPTRPAARRASARRRRRR
jgi:hypothetical protein